MLRSRILLVTFLSDLKRPSQKLTAMRPDAIQRALRGQSHRAEDRRAPVETKVGTERRHPDGDNLDSWRNRV